jgi:spore germination cell wall hydrolase CwlJ-like protein
MKIIITENQLKKLKIILESNSGCPDGTKISSLVTLEDVKNGSIISKGYCNGSSNSAIVKIQQMLKSKNLLDSSSPEGYYGDKTKQAIIDLFKPKNITVSGDKIGPKTVTELEKEKGVNSETKKTNKANPNDAEVLFNNLSDNTKVLVCTLLGEAGGESDSKKGMQAVANVLKNRAESNHQSRGKTAVEQALSNKQFSMWNSYNNGSLTKQDVYNKYKKHDQMKSAIDIVNSMNTINDLTKGANYYYADYVSPAWSKSTDTTNWVKTAEIGSHVFGNVVQKPKKKKN